MLFGAILAYIIYGYRYYSPEFGRWLTRDPLGEEGGENLYCFVSNNSVLNVDALGEISLTPFWICFASCWVDIPEDILKTYRDGDPDSLSRDKRRKLEKRFLKEYKKETKGLTKVQKRAWRKTVLKKVMRSEGIRIIRNKILKKLGTKVGVKFIAFIGGTVTGGASTYYSIVSGASDIYEICKCAAKCK